MSENLKRVVVVMDYQNIHLTAHDQFAGHTEPWESLIHSLHFGNHVVSTRNHRCAELQRRFLLGVVGGQDDDVVQAGWHRR